MHSFVIVFGSAVLTSERALDTDPPTASPRSSRGLNFYLNTNVCSDFLATV